MYGVLVAESVGTFDRIVHVPAPVVFIHVAERRIDSIPPCAATVWERVGNSLDIHAVFSPCSVRPTAARRPAPLAPMTMVLGRLSC